MKLKIEYIDPRSLIAYENNSRVHSADQIDRIKRSIEEFGFINPVIIDESNTIVAGHARVEAAMSLGLAEVPTIELSNLTEEQIRAYVIADNKLAELSDWNDEILKLELNDLGVNGFDLDLVGFDSDELSRLFDETADIQIEDMIDDLDQFEVNVKCNPEMRVDVLNALYEAVKQFADVEIICNE